MIDIPLNSICVDNTGYYYLCKKLYGQKAFTTGKWHFRDYYKVSKTIVKYAKMTDLKEGEKILRNLNEQKISLESLNFTNINA